MRLAQSLDVIKRVNSAMRVQSGPGINGSFNIIFTFIEIGENFFPSNLTQIYCLIYMAYLAYARVAKVNFDPKSEISLSPLNLIFLTPFFYCIFLICRLHPPFSSMSGRYHFILKVRWIFRSWLKMLHWLRIFELEVETVYFGWFWDVVSLW